ncbi:MAG: hypothetical protein CMN30_25265 [Sandaracinus sp.]|nr:hypothetical protein [Sandaracinus sp.]
MQPRLKVIGVGGAGGNAIAALAKDVPAGLDPQSDLWVANTDAQALRSHDALRTLALGPKRTGGLGAGGRPEVGEAAAIDSARDITDALEGANLVFVTAGMGGGTGTGAAAVVAAAAREVGALTIGVFSRPFAFEGRRRAKAADEGLARTEEQVDCCVVIENQHLLQGDLSMQQAFARADEVLAAGVRGIGALLGGRGMINLDLADLAVCLQVGGRAVLGLGEGPDPLIAAQRAVACDLLADTDLTGAGGLLISFRGPRSLGLRAIDQAATWLADQVDPDAEVHFGLVTDDSIAHVEATVVATGLGREPVQVAPAAPRNALVML